MRYPFASVVSKAITNRWASRTNSDDVASSIKDASDSIVLERMRLLEAGDAVFERFVVVWRSISHFQCLEKLLDYARG